MRISRIVSFVCSLFLFLVIFHLSSSSASARISCSVPQYKSANVKGFCVYPRNFYDQNSMGNVTWTVEKGDFCQSQRPGTNCPALPDCSTMFPEAPSTAVVDGTNKQECLGSSDETDYFKCCFVAPPDVTPDNVAGEVKNPCPNGVCVTSLGIVQTDPTNFINFLFRIVLSLSGGIAIIMIIISGYSYSLSRGNPEKLKGAQEMLTSAIIGLVFIIFSTVILEVIGVDILQLPGFIR